MSIGTCACDQIVHPIKSEMLDTSIDAENLAHFWLSITHGWCREVRIVCSRAILRVKNDEIVTLAALAVVVGLEVTRSLRKTKVIEDIVVCVGGVEELCNRRVAVCRRGSPAGAPVVLEIKSRARWAVVTLPCRTTVGVSLSNGVV